MDQYDAIVVGGGIAGLQAAIQLGRYLRSVAVIDAGGGRSSVCRQYSNLLGWPEGVSGPWLRATGKGQAEQLNITFVQAEAAYLDKAPAGFVVLDRERLLLAEGRTVLLATGIADHIPHLAGLDRCLGVSVYICPDCDGYEAVGCNTVVMGSGNAGAHMAIAVSYWARRVAYINHTGEAVDAELARQLHELGIEQIGGRIAEVAVGADGMFRAALLANGAEVAGDRAFIAFGGSRPRTELARQLGVACADNGHVIVDARTKETSVPGVWAAGDIGLHSQMLAVALGEGMLAAVWMHKRLLQLQHQLIRVHDDTRPALHARPH